VWNIYTDERVVHVYAADGRWWAVRQTATLVEDELLPGFALPLHLVFE